MVNDYSIPVIWDGREVGNVSLEAGEVLELLSVQGEVLVCKRAKQTVRIPARYTNYNPQIHKPDNPAKAKAALETNIEAFKPTLPEDAKPATDKSSYPLWLPPELSQLARYAASIQKLTETQKKQMRYYLYANSQYHQADNYRYRIAEWSEQQDNSPKLTKFLMTFDQAIKAFEKRDWEVFEILILQVSEIASVKNSF